MRQVLVVATGGALGAGVRWSVGELIERQPGGFPWATLAVNLAGCLLAGIALRVLVRGSTAWLAAVTGLLGGLTTYSAFAVETRDLLGADRPAWALAYVLVSVGGGMLAVELGRAGR